MLDYFKENHVTKSPTLLEVNGCKFFVCLYTGALTIDRVGIPEFLLNGSEESGKDKKGDYMWGSFRDWNTLARFILDGLELGKITPLHKDALFSWISAFTECTDSVTIPPRRSELERFGGHLSDDEFLAKYAPMRIKSINVGDEEDAREITKALRKANSESQPPKLQQAIKNLVLPNQLTHLHVTIATPSTFWIERAAAPWSPSNVTEAVEKTLKEWELTGARVPEIGANKIPAEFYGPKKCPRNVTRMFPRPTEKKDTAPLPKSHVNPSAGPKKRTAGGKNKSDVTGADASAPVTTKTPKSKKVAIVAD